MGWQQILAEAVSYLLGRRLGLPIPSAAVCLDDHERSWLSRCIESVKHWDPAKAILTDNISDLGCALTVDAIVYNEDRHLRNLLLEATEMDEHYKLWIIDFDSALIGYPHDFIAKGLEVPSPHNLAKGIPIDLIEEQAISTARKAAELSKDELRHMTAEACWIARDNSSEQLAHALSQRCMAAESILEEYLKRIRSQEVTK